MSAVEGLSSLFRPSRVAVVGATPNDPKRMGTRTLHDLVESGWAGEVFPVSARHGEIYGRRAYAALRDLPAAPDVVLARVPAASVADVVDDACAVGARHLVVLASGFAESGAQGVAAQRALVERAGRGGLRVLGPQSIGLVNLVDRLPLSLSQIMERLVLRPGRVALVTQSGAMAVSLAVRGQELYGVDFSYVVTLGNAADIDVPEVLAWLAADEHTEVVGLYLEAASDLAAFARAVAACRSAGRRVVVLRSGASAKGAQAVASHTASLAGDASVFDALCRQLGVVLADSGEAFLVALKALSGRVPAAPVRTALASVSGGACALWADGAERHGFDVPDLDASQAAALGARLPSFLKAGNPLDLGPAIFDRDVLLASLASLANPARVDLVAVYLFTSSPSLMGGLERIADLEAFARTCPLPVWVAWEAATAAEWERLARSDALTAFREMGQAVLAAGQARIAQGVVRYREGPAPGTCPGALRGVAGEAAIKAVLRERGFPVPRGALVRDADEALAVARAWACPVVLKAQGPAIAHKSELGGVVPCPGGAVDVPSAFARLQSNLRDRGAGEDWVPYAEEFVDAPGIELFVTVRHLSGTGWVTTLGRGGTAIEVERDFRTRVGALDGDDVRAMLAELRCAPLLRGFRGGAAVDIEAFVDLASGLPALIGNTHDVELELNPVKVTAAGAWILDALLRDGAPAA